VRLKCDDTRAKTRFRPSAKRMNPFKSAGASVQSTTGSQGMRISGSNAGYTMFRGSVKSTGYPLHSPVSSSLPLSCVTVWHHISTGLYTMSRPNYSSQTGSVFRIYNPVPMLPELPFWLRKTCRFLQSLKTIARCPELLPTTFPPNNL